MTKQEKILREVNKISCISIDIGRIAIAASLVIEVTSITVAMITKVIFEKSFAPKKK